MLSDKYLTAIADPRTLRALSSELQYANIVKAQSVAAVAVKMNSTIVLKDLKSDETDTYTLVYPDQANIAEGRLSVLARIGTAILGYRVQWAIPSGESDMRIEAVSCEPEPLAVIV